MKKYIVAKITDVNDENYEGLLSIARNPRTRPTDLKRIYDSSPTISVMAELAKNPNTPVTILTDLAHFSNSSVKAGLVLNPNTPEDIKEQLLNSYHVLSSLAWWSDIPVEFFPELFDIIENSAELLTKYELNDLLIALWSRSELPENLRDKLISKYGYTTEIWVLFSCYEETSELLDTKIIPQIEDEVSKNPLFIDTTYELQETDTDVNDDMFYIYSISIYLKHDKPGDDSAPEIVDQVYEILNENNCNPLDWSSSEYFKGI